MPNGARWPLTMRVLIFASFAGESLKNIKNSIKIVHKCNKNLLHTNISDLSVFSITPPSWHWHTATHTANNHKNFILFYFLHTEKNLNVTHPLNKVWMKTSHNRPDALYVRELIKRRLPDVCLITTFIRSRWINCCVVIFCVTALLIHSHC